jgi:hypothetical protein
MGFTHSGQVVKHALAELVGSGCRIETVAFDPPALHFRTPDGARCAVVVEGDTVVVEHPDGPGRFHSLRSALRAACQPLAQPGPDPLAQPA